MDAVYRRLQQHLDSQPIGFPSTLFGSDIRLLKRLFSIEEAKVALRLSYKSQPFQDIARKTSPDFSAAETDRLLQTMLTKGTAARKEKDAIACWYVMPLVVGIYECQDGDPDREFQADAHAYMKTPAYGKSFIGVKPSQMRTIPINRSIKVEHAVATYDQVRSIVLSAPGPFVVLKCICRETRAAESEPCKKTSRRETCLGFNHLASMVLARKHGREISREEALEILEQNERDGLVLQPANSRHPDFVCSCCGCCCGMLRIQQRLPHPVDFWTSSFRAEVDRRMCTGCGKCAARCQVKAVALTTWDRKAEVNPSRCIGCGLCVPTCQAAAMKLKKTHAVQLPKNEEEYFDQVKANRKSRWGETITFLKVLLGMRNRSA